MTDILIIGAGTAGLTAGIYAVRAGKTALVLESESFGGQIITTPDIENFPSIKRISGYDFAKNLMEQAVELGVEIDSDKITALNAKSGHIEASGEDKSIYKAKAVIVATGAKARQLGLVNENKFIGRGISYCALCDGAFFKGKTVAVNGGGSTALEEAVYLAEKCKKVYLIHRRDEFRGENKLVEQAKSKHNIEMVLNSKIIGLVGTNRLESIDVADVVSGKVDNIALDGLFVSIVRAPDNAFLSDKIKLDEKGYIIAGEDCRTNMDGVFAAGDCRTKEVRQLTTAAADGTVSAVLACAFIDNL